MSNEVMAPSSMDMLVEAGMLFNTGKKVVMFVEGDSDRRLYQSLFDQTVSVLPAHSYSNVESIITKYNTEKKDALPLILGVVDRDYRIACGQVTADNNLICTELRDIECEMVNSNAFNSVIEEFSSNKLREKWPHIDEFKAHLISNVAEVGRVRFFNHVKQTAIDFKQFNYEKIYDLKSHKVKNEKILPHLRGSQKPGIKLPKDFNEVSKLSQEKRYTKHLSNPLRLARGHDFFDLLAFYFKKGFGRNGLSVSAENLESAIRIGYKPIIKNSPTMGKIIDWFKANHMVTAIL